MWDQVYTPVGASLPASATCAAIPILVMLLALGILRLPAWKAGLLGLASVAVVAGAIYGMPVRLIASSAAYGAAFGLFPIAWIVFWAVVLYRFTVETGQFELIKASFGRLTEDSRLQALLVAFAFGAFIEGACGFGTPVAVAAAMLTGLGVPPFRAAAICLLANTAPVAFGAIGTPLVTLAGVTSLPLPVLSAEVGRICAPVSLFIPAYLIAVMGGRGDLRAVWPAALVCGVCFAATQFTVSTYVGPYLTDILAALASMLGMAVLLRFWRPADKQRRASRPGEPRPSPAPAYATGSAPENPLTRDHRLASAGAVYAARSNTAASLASDPDLASAAAAHVTGSSTCGREPVIQHQDLSQSGAAMLRAWSPYMLLVVFVLLWGVGPIKALLDKATVVFAWPGLEGEIRRLPPVVAHAAAYPAKFTFNMLSSSGTAALLATLCAAGVLRVPFGRVARVIARTARDLALPILTIASVLALAYLMNYSGCAATLGLAFAASGILFPFFSAPLGWLAVFLTGSDTSANALFGNLQVVTANRLGLPPELMAAANSSGGVMGKMISLQSICVAAAATGMPPEDESRLFRFTLRHSIFLACVIGVIVVIYTYLLPAR